MGSVVLVPSEPDGPVAFEVAAGTGSVAPEATCQPGTCILTRRKLRFVPGYLQTVRVDLRRSCQGVSCSADETCVRGSCVGAEVGPCIDLACDETALLGKPASRWEVVSSGVTTDLWAIEVRRDGTLLVAGDAGTLLSSRDGRTWASVAAPRRNYRSLLETAAGSLLATTAESTVVRLEGSNEVPLSSVLYSMANDGGSVVGVGSGLSIATSVDDGVTFSVTRPLGTQSTWTGIGVAGGERILAAADGGIATSSATGVYTFVPLPASGKRGGVFVRSPEDIFVAGQPILRRREGRWAAIVSPVDALFRSVTGTPDGRVWAVSELGDILRIEGDSVVLEDQPIRRPLFHVRALSGNRILAVGSGGTILLRHP